MMSVGNEGCETSHLRRTGIVLFGVVGFASIAHAEDLVNAQHAGAGGTVVAHPRSNAAITLSPATLGFRDRYDIEILGLGGGAGWRWGASAVDSRSSKWVAFGLAYNGGITNDDFLPDELPGWALADEDPINRKQFHDISVGLSGVFLDRRLGVGLSGTLQILDTNRLGNRVTGNLDAGIAGEPVEYLSLAFSARDILPVADQFDRPATLAFGFRSGVEDLIMTSFDAEARLEHVVSNPWGVKLGVEGSIREVVHLRGGYDWNGDTDIHGVSFGLGVYANQAGSIDYSFRVPVNQDALKFVDVTHTLSLTIYTRFQMDDPLDVGDDALEWDGR